MSRTRKTAPGWARMLSNPARLTQEFHDHRNGICDLKEDPNDPDLVRYGERRGYLVWGVERGECYRGPSQEFWYGKDSGCPCWMCHDSYGCFRGRRRNRHEARVTGRQMLRVLNAGGGLDELG